MTAPRPVGDRQYTIGRLLGRLLGRGQQTDRAAQRPVAAGEPATGLDVERATGMQVSYAPSFNDASNELLTAAMSRAHGEGDPYWNGGRPLRADLPGGASYRRDTARARRMGPSWMRP